MMKSRDQEQVAASNNYRRPSLEIYGVCQKFQIAQISRRKSDFIEQLIEHAENKVHHS